MKIAAFGLSNNFNQLSIKYEASHEVLWTCFDQKNMIPCFNHELISELTAHQKEVEKSGGVLYSGDAVHQIRYSVAASVTPNVFNLGGHLALIRDLATKRHKEALLSYATKGIDVLANKLSRFNNSPIINISLVQGLALGGGLEAALASDIIIAERRSLFGFPEILFNMFPGMGGYSLVARKAGVKIADEMILKGKQYTAEQAFEMGIVDVLVEDGEGEKAVYNWIEKNRRFSNGYLAAQKAKGHINPITVDELMDITKLWVDVALKLSDREFSIMERFIYNQEKQYVHTPSYNQNQFANNIVPLRQSA